MNFNKYQFPFRLAQIQDGFFAKSANSRRAHDSEIRETQHFEGLSNWRVHCTSNSGTRNTDTQIGRKVAMDRMLVVVFDTEPKAYEGKKALFQLETEGSVSVYAYAVVAKNGDGTTTVRQGDDMVPLGTLIGTPLGSLIG